MEVFTKGVTNSALIKAFSQDLASDLIYPVFQGIFDIDEKIVGYEILSRWDKYHGGEFVEILEKESYHLYLNLNILRLNDAICLVNELCLSNNKDPFYVSVNIGPLMLLNDKFYEKLTDVLKDSIQALLYIKFEFTEQFNLKDPLLHMRLIAINKLGVRLSIGNFSLGFSDIELLKNLPVDEIKIDRRFVKHIAHNLDDAQLFGAMMRVVFTAKKNIVVEGVETQSQLTLIRAIGCTYVQGFLFGIHANKALVRNRHKIVN